MRNEQSLALSHARPLTMNIVFTVLAVGLGITVPKIFHLFGLGPAFLPMFLPVVLLGLLTGYPYVIAASVITPLLSYGLTGMPPAPIAAHMTVQLAFLGSALVFLTHNMKLKYIYAIPIAVLSERVLSLAAASVSGSEHLTAGGIAGSYPGMLMIIVVSMIVMKLYDR
jgi:hypothetical protein